MASLMLRSRITKECIFKEGVLGYGPEAKLNLNCSDAGIKYGNATGVSPLCALDVQGFCTDGTQIPSNPFTAGEVAILFAYLSLDQPTDTFVGNTGWFVHGNNGAWNVVFCNVTALDVTYTYASSRFLLQNAIPKSVADAQHMMAAGFNIGPAIDISKAVDGAGLEINATYEQAYSIELSWQMLARGAFIYEPTEVNRIQSESNIVGSNLRLIPLVLFIVAILITLKVTVAVWNVKFVSLAALSLWLWCRPYTDEWIQR
ncbi:hypothetical protein CVT25_002747 [Psilocybe cyanescens]|uniref:Uncharacterized protein n=1 Tax=Psilocybe cyanescens TaxID=93625 RepID=A0A409XUM0_PSICY|nr:hypothetical protein CVT25_002747 [Psilocybe cyanescens]